MRLAYRRETRPEQLDAGYSRAYRNGERGKRHQRHRPSVPAGRQLPRGVKVGLPPEFRPVGSQLAGAAGVKIGSGWREPTLRYSVSRIPAACSAAGLAG